MIDDDVFREEIEISLRQATDGQLARIMQFIDRLPSRGRLDDVVAPIRGRLALTRPARSITPARVLTAPIEDLLVDPACEAASPHALPRDILAVFHRIALDSFDPVELAVLEDEAQGGVMDDADTVLSMGRRLWPAAATALRAFSPDAQPTPPGWRPEHGPRLRVIADLLAHGETLLGFLDRLPVRGAPCKADSDHVACDMLSWTAAQSDELGRCCAAMLLRRLSDPAPILALAAQAGCADADAAVRRLLTRAVDDCLREAELTIAAAADASAVAIAADAGPTPFADAEILSRLATALKALESGPSPEGVNFAVRLAAANGAAQALAETLYQRLLGGAAGARLAAVAEAGPAASDDDIAETEALARAAAKISAAGASLGCAARLTDAARPWRDDMRRRIVANTSGLSDSAARFAAIIDGLRLMEIALGADEAAALVDSLGAVAEAPANPRNTGN